MFNSTSVEIFTTKDPATLIRAARCWARVHGRRTDVYVKHIHSKPIAIVLYFNGSQPMDWGQTYYQKVDEFLEEVMKKGNGHGKDK